MRDRYLDILEHMRAMVSEIDECGRMTYVSPTVHDVLGYQPEEVLERPGFSWIHNDDREQLRELFVKALETGQPTRHVCRALHKNGHWVWLESSGRTYRGADGSLRAVAFARDVSELVRAGEALRESEDRFHTLAANATDLILELDAEGRYLYVSPACASVLGVPAEALVGRSMYEADIANNIHPDDRERVLRRFAARVSHGGPGSELYRYRHHDDSWRWFETRARSYRASDGAVRVVVIARDATRRIRDEEERAELEARVRQAQKLEGLGVMAGGIAHDFNNLLTPILGDASLALMELPADSPLRERMQRIQKAAHRAAALTHQMLAYAGKSPLLVERVNLSRLVLEMARLLEAAVTKKAALSYELAADTSAIDGDVSQLSQLVMNLVTNASEALGDRSGRIEVRTGSVDAAGAAGRATLFGGDLRSGPCVYLEVSDNGCGMDEPTRSRIFDPFFSTKFTGRGLGLASALGIVRGHEGAIEIESEPGRGTRFRVVFPSSSARSRRIGVPEPPEPWQARGTALVVDDEENVRALVCETLERAGLAVVCAADGREALRLFRHRPGEFDIVLLDRTLPHKGGEEVFDAIRGVRPDARVLLMSGYGEERVSARFAGKGLAGFLQKPFLPSTLVERVRAVLERDGAA